MSDRVTMKEVRAALNKDDYQAAKTLGAGAIPHLRKIVAEDDALMAPKAVFLAGLINSKGSAEVVAKAAKSRKVGIQTAAAAAAAYLDPEEAAPILKGLFKSRRVVLRKWALKSVPSNVPEELREPVLAISKSDSRGDLRAAAKRTLRAEKLS